MEEATIKKGYRNAWILLGLAVFFVVAAFWFTLDKNTPAHEPEWNMGGQKFVPAASPYADGYYVPDVPDKGVPEKDVPDTGENKKGLKP